MTLSNYKIAIDKIKATKSEKIICMKNYQKRIFKCHQPGTNFVFMIFRIITPIPGKGRAL